MIYFLLLTLAPLLALALFLMWRNTSSSFFHWRRSKRASPAVEDAVPHEKRDPYRDIEPLHNFDWRNTRPLFCAPLRPKYHLTMALETILLSELVEIDDTYLDRLRIRREVIKEHEEATLQCNPVCGAAAMELYEWMTGTYLPGRFPTMYERVAQGLRSRVPGRVMPWKPATAKDALRLLGENVDTDFLLLLPSSAASDGSPVYHLEAFITCFPSGFSTREKLGLPLAQIHTPVPGYDAKLGKSMDRFFARLECGKVVKRSNWALTTDDKLFAEGGTHLYEDGKTERGVRRAHETVELEDALDVDAEIERQKAEVVLENCRLRSERQTLFRLPRTRALVFSFKTYQYRLEDVKRDGLGEELAEAMVGLAKGNVPEMDFYKRGVVWREKVVEFLRS